MRIALVFCRRRKSRVSRLFNTCCPEDFFFLLPYCSRANCLLLSPYSISFSPTHLLLWLNNVCNSVINYSFAGLRSCCFFGIIEATDWHHSFGGNPVTIRMRAKRECTSAAMLPFQGALKWLKAGPRSDVIPLSIFFPTITILVCCPFFFCFVYSVDWILSNHNCTLSSTWTHIDKEKLERFPLCPHWNVWKTEGSFISTLVLCHLCEQCKWLWIGLQEHGEPTNCMPKAKWRKLQYI